MTAAPRASESSLPPDQRRMRLVLGDVLPSGRPSEARRSTPPSPEKARQYAERCPPRVDYHAEAQGRAIAVGFIVLLAVSALIAIAL